MAVPMPMASAADRGIAVALTEISVEFAIGRRSIFKAIAPMSLGVAEGEFVAIVGPTGCGKSTLLNLAAGLLKPTTGRIEIFGEPLGGLNLKAGYLFQQDGADAVEDRARQCGDRAEIRGRPRSEARDAGAGLARRRSASAASATAIRISSRAASASASGWPRC